MCVKAKMISDNDLIFNKMSSDPDEYRKKTNEKNKLSFFGLVLIVGGILICSALFDVAPGLGFIIMIVMVGFGIAYIFD